MSRIDLVDDPQPWRCARCGEAVSHLRRNLCACLRPCPECGAAAPHDDNGEPPAHLTFCCVNGHHFDGPKNYP